MIESFRLEHFMTLWRHLIQFGTYQLAYVARKEWIHFLRRPSPSKCELPRPHEPGAQEARIFLTGEQVVSPPAPEAREQNPFPPHSRRPFCSPAHPDFLPSLLAFLFFSFPFAQVIEFVLLAVQPGQQACITVAGSPSIFRKLPQRVHAFVNQGRTFISQ